MRSVCTPGFWRRLNDLPDGVRAQATVAYNLWREDTHYPSLHFKALGGKRAIFSVRIGAQYRALARGRSEAGEDVYEWFWIGTHADYDDIIRSL